MSSQEEKRVCVTGGSGFIASWIVKLLLECGYVVHATVRSLNDPTKTEHLLALEGAKTRLHLFEANLVEEGSFDLAIHGCSGVFHTASPVLAETSNPQEDLIEPALKGTKNVLASCARTPSVKRVILTSSVVAVIHTGRPITSETVLDETSFSSPEYCKGIPLAWYVLSKTLAETAAWEYANEKGIDMVSVNPGVVIGPMLQPVVNWSSDQLFNLINGARFRLFFRYIDTVGCMIVTPYGLFSEVQFKCKIFLLNDFTFTGKSDVYMNIAYSWVHVKDVAEAHIRAFEIPSANGRYILVESVAHFSHIVTILRELYPNLKLPHKCVDDQPLQPTYRFSKEKVVRSLDIEYIPLKVALKESVEFFVQKKLISV